MTKCIRCRTNCIKYYHGAGDRRSVAESGVLKKILSPSRGQTESPSHSSEPVFGVTVLDCMYMGNSQLCIESNEQDPILCVRTSEKSSLANFFFLRTTEFSASRDIASTRTLGAGPI